MHYYLIELSNPTKLLRHYRNSRVASYTVNELNKVSGFERYAYAESTDKFNIDSVGEDPVQDKVNFLREENGE